MNKITIVNMSSATRKVCTFANFAARGAWAVLRYPSGAGLFSFSLVHGGMECKRGEQPQWRLSDGDLEKLREAAELKNIKRTRKPKCIGRPKKPERRTEQRQTELFK